VQTGADLQRFSPASCVNEIWPRPILVVHGIDDPIISFPRGKSLFDHAQQPKSRIWISGGGHNDIIHDEQVARRVREFFQSAQRVPVI
jgi:fermentation-respiration switch protein FrsA (DUF1100 family)